MSKIYQLLPICLMLCVMSCSKNFCETAHQSMKKGAANLEVRWQCKKIGCLYQKANYVVDGTICRSHPDTETRLAASLVCMAATQAFAVLGTSLISKACDCNANLVYSDLAMPSKVCPLFDVILP